MSTDTAKREAPSRAAKEVVGSPTLRESHNRYQSVAVEFMKPEIHRTVIERMSSNSETMQSKIHESLLKALWRYTGVPTENIAVAPSISTLINWLMDRYQQNRKTITCIGPISPEICKLVTNECNVIPSLIDSSSKEISEALPESTQVLYIASPSMISGEVHTASQMERILTYAESATVIVNESLFEYCNATCIRLLERFENLVILRTLSEAFGIEDQPVAYALGNKTVIENLRNQIPPGSIASVALITADAALKRQDVMRHTVNTICENRVYLTALLRRLGAEVVPTPVDFLLMKISNPEMALELLEPHGVTLCEYAHKGQLQRFLRIPVGNERYCRSIVSTLTRCPREYYSPIISDRNYFKTDKTQAHYQYNTNMKEVQR